jgi:hypothetical protein
MRASEEPVYIASFGKIQFLPSSRSWCTSPEKQTNNKLGGQHKCTNVLQYLTLRDSPCGGTSKAATVAVTTRVVSLLIRKIIIFFQISSETTRVVTATVVAFDVPPQVLLRNITTRLQVFGSEHHVKKDSTFFFH